MSSSASPSASKSKKPTLRSTPKSKALAPIATQTPDKPPTGLPPRLRNRRVALSLKEVRVVAQGCQDGIQTRQSERTGKSARRKIASWTEESASGGRSVRSRSVEDKAVKLPEKYEMLGEFFDSLDSSIRLLRLKGSMSTFTNICPKIECLTDRRFSYQNLAQLKHVLPEAIEIKRVLIFDERTSCMKPDLHVAINVDAIECDEKAKSESKNMYLRKVFRERLAEFYNAYPERDEIPEELLPEPFNRSKHDLNPTSTSPTEATSDTHIDHSPNSLPMEAEPAVTQQPEVLSHFSQSFRRHFSKKVADIVSPELTKGDSCSTSCVSTFNMPKPNLPMTPTKGMDTTNSTCDSSTKMASFPSTPAGTPSIMMSTTPAQHPPKRCHMSPDDSSTLLPDKLVRRPTLIRPLNFGSPSKNIEDKVNLLRNAPVDDDVSNILPESLLQSIREKERKAKEERDPAISQAKRRRQMIACLPKLFNMIHFLFQSIRQSVITKDELIHKIIASHLDIVDKREVEEQLSLLLELVPDWISEKLASTGDLLLCINKMSSPETIRAQLEGSK